MKVVVIDGVEYELLHRGESSWGFKGNGEILVVSPITKPGVTAVDIIDTIEGMQRRIAALEDEVASGLARDAEICGALARLENRIELLVRGV